MEHELRRHQGSLEDLVEERTGELKKVNEQLQLEIVERKRVEEALRASEEKYRDLVENANSIILRMDAIGCVTFFNEFAQKFFGYGAGEIIGKNVVGTIVPSTDTSGQDLAKMIEDIGLHPEQYATNENENMRRDGKRVWVAWTNRAILDENGNVTEILCIGNDITDRKRTEEALRRARDELSTLLQVAQAASSSLELDKVLKVVARGITVAVGVRHCGIYMLDEEKSLLVPMEGTSTAASPPGLAFEQAFKNRPLDPRRDAFTREVLETMEPVVCYDAETDPRTDKETVHLLGLKSVLAVPFVIKEKVVAVAMVSTFDDHYLFTDEQMKLAKGIANAAAVAVENARLYAETRRRADETQTLFAVQQAITSHLDPDAVLQLIADEARRLTSARLASVFLLEGKDLRISVVSGEARPDLLDIRMSVEQSFSGLAVLTGKPVRVDDIRSDPIANADIVRRAGIKPYLAVPLLSGSGPIGIISAADKLSGTFGPDDERVMTLLATGAVIGLENARLFHEEQERHHEDERRRRVAESLRGILAILNSNSPLTEILDYIVAEACQVLGTDAGAIYRLGPDGQQLSIQAAHGLDSDYIANVTIPIGRGAVGRAVLQRQPVTFSDITSALTEDGDSLSPSTRPYMAQLISRHTALLAVPLVVKDEVYGGIALYYAERREFSADEIDLAVTFSDQAALAIENARLRAQAEQAAAAAERNRLARDLHDAVTQTLFSASLIAEVLPRLWERNPEEGKRRLDELRQLTRGALAEMRTLLLELRPATLMEAALGDLLRHLTEAVTGWARIPVSLEVEGEVRLPPDVQVALYRIAQEALNNVAKHAGAKKASVKLQCWPGNVELCVNDDGRGFEFDGIAPEHLGLGIMRERAEAIGGMLNITSQPGNGTQIVISWQDTEEKENSLPGQVTG